MTTADAARQTLGNRQATLPGSSGEAEPGIVRRHRLRRRAGQIIGGRTAYCGRRVIGTVDDGCVSVWRSEEGAAYFGNLTTCGSVWACPVCAAKVARARAETLTELSAAHAAQGGAMAFLTLTQRHHARQRVDDLRAALMDGWAHLTSGRNWQYLKERFGLIGFCRVIEVTHGANGWHPHVHALLYFDRDLTPHDLTTIRRLIYCRWARKLRGDVWNRGRRSYARGSNPCPSYAHGCDLVQADPADAGTVAAYLAKWGAGMELSGAAMKSGRKGNRTPFQLLNAADNGDYLAGRLFKSYARAFKGARHMAISPALRDRYGVELTEDEEAAANQPEIGDLNNGVDCGLVGFIDGETWRQIDERGITAEAAQVVSRDGYMGLVSWLASEFGLRVIDRNAGEWHRRNRPQPPPERPIREHYEAVISALEAPFRSMTPAERRADHERRRKAVLERIGFAA